jgi:hypothetical protein
MCPTLTSKEPALEAEVPEFAVSSIFASLGKGEITSCPSVRLVTPPEIKIAQVVDRSREFLIIRP